MNAAPPSIAAPALYPGYRTRYLPAMTRSQIGAIPDRAKAVVVIPTGAVEQHAHHLPVGVDAILGQAWLTAALPHVPADKPIYVGPAVTYGISEEHIGFPGTVSISPKTFHRLLKIIARQIHALGFRTMAVLNTHGGNSPTLVATLRGIQAAMNMNACMLAPTWKPPVSEQEATYGFHAGRVETAWMLAVAPHLVHMERARCEYPAQVDEPGELRPENAPATFSWISADISKSGVMGDATAARVDEGQTWFQSGARSLAERMIALADAVSTQ